MSNQKRMYDGSVLILSNDAFPQIVKIRDCLCGDGKRRTVSRLGKVQGGYAPAMVVIKGRAVRGMVMVYERGCRFHALQYRKNGHLLQFDNGYLAMREECGKYWVAGKWVVGEDLREKAFLADKTFAEYLKEARQ